LDSFHSARLHNALSPSSSSSSSSSSSQTSTVSFDHSFESSPPSFSSADSKSLSFFDLLSPEQQQRLTSKEPEPETKEDSQPETETKDSQPETDAISETKSFVDLLSDEQRERLANTHMPTSTESMTENQSFSFFKHASVLFVIIRIACMLINLFTYQITGLQVCLLHTSCSCVLVRFLLFRSPKLSLRLRKAPL
jgi:hypothetical protein